jgi:hypothetical protein
MLGCYLLQQVWRNRALRRLVMDAFDLKGVAFIENQAA